MSRAEVSGRTVAGEPSPRILTFLIADVRGYTAFTQAHGDEAAARLAAAFAEIVREGVEARGGEVIELRGDEALAVFASARQALRAAVELQLTFVDEVERNHALPLRVGIGMDAGEAVPVEGGYRGGALNLAARLCGQAGPGEVLASQEVVHLGRAVQGIRVVERGTLELKGLAEPVRVMRAIAEGADDLGERLARASAPPAPRRPSEVPPELDPATLMAGRGYEARRLRWWWRQARRGAGRGAFVVGERGMGKTRLAAEPASLARGDGARVFYASAAQGSIAAAAGAAAKVRGPLLLVADDLDEAEHEDLEALERVLDGIEERPHLVVGMLREGGGTGRLATLVREVAAPRDASGAREAGPHLLRLAPLDQEAVREVIALYADSASQGLPAAAILEASEGVPLEVHRLAGEWARGEAARRLGESAARAAARRNDLRTLEAELAGNVIDLQLVRDRSRQYGEPPGRAAIDGTRVSPFKGLASFDVGDADVFFGRERLVAEMVGRLAGSTLLGVVGPSGSGKSSAVRAGLMPALAAGTLPGSERWIRTVLRPGAYPLRALDRAMWASLPEDLRGRIEGTDLPLRAARDAIGPEQRLVVLVDQFEEVFTLCRDEDDRAAFVRALVEAAGDPRGNSLVIVAVRADFYGRCAAYPALAELLGASHVLVGPMTGDEYRRAIEQPALRSGLRVEPALVDALVEEVQEEPGGLPLLSSALLELWQHRTGRTITLDAYRRTGGVRGAVARLAEDAYGALDQDEEPVARAVMLRLAGPGEGESPVRRRVAVGEFDAERDERVARVLQVFTEARLVTVSDGAVEVAHEALLREWPRLREWLDEDRAGRRLHGHLIEAAKEWEGSGRDPGELYRGARLASAIDWTTEHSLELNELEREFLNQSRTAAERDAERQRRTNRRLRALLAGVALFLVLALVGGALALVQRGRAERAAAEATAQRLGAQALIEEDLDRSLLLARQAVELDDSVETRSDLLASLLRSPAAIAVMHGTGDRVQWIGLSPDGGTLAVGDHVGGLALFDAVGFRPLGTPLRLAEGTFGHAFTPDSRTLVMSGLDEEEQSSLVFLDLATRDVSYRPYERGWFGWDRMAFSPDGRTLVTTEGREVPGGPPVSRLVARSPAGEPTGLTADLPAFDFVFGAEYTDDGKLLIVSGVSPVPGGEHTLVFDAATLRLQETFEAGGGVDVDPDGRTVALGSHDGSVTFLDLETGEQERGSGRHTAGVTGLAFSPDRNTLVSVGDDNDVLVWDVATRTVRETLEGHRGRVSGPAFSPDGRTVYTSGLDGSVIAWDLAGDRRLGRPFEFDPLDGPGAVARAISPDGRTLALGAPEGRVVLWDLEALRPDEEIEVWDEASLRPIQEAVPEAPIQGAITSLEFAPDGKLLAVGSDTGQPALVDVEAGSVIARLEPGHESAVTWLDVSPDGQSVLSAGDDGAILWDIETGERVQEYRPAPGGEAPLAEANFSPDGTRLATASFVTGEVVMWDARSGRRLWTRRADLWDATTVRFSPDGSLLAAGGTQAGEVVFFDAATGKPTGRAIQAVAGFVLSIAFDPAGRVLASSGSDGTVKLWDVATRQQIGSTLPGLDNERVMIDFSPSGEGLVALYTTGRGYVWTVDPQDWKDQACRVAGRALTRDEWERFLPHRPFEPACAG